MRLLIATPLYPPEPGGPATYARLLEAQLPQVGIQVALLKFSAVRRLPKIVRHVYYTFLLLRAGRDADAILALDPVSTGFPAMVASLALRKPFFVKIVGDYAWEQGSQRFGVRESLDHFVHNRHVPMGVAVLRNVQTMVARQAKMIIVPSNYLRTIVSLWGIPSQKISVVYNAMQTEVAGVVPLTVQHMTRPRVVSVGRLVPWKGMPGVIDAVVDIKAEFPEVTLAIAGDGPDRDTLEHFMHVRLGTSGTMLGSLSHADALAVIHDADVFVLNSTYEGLSHLLIEAMALGKAIIATNVGGNPELIEDGKNGLLVPEGDRAALVGALSHLLKTPTHRATLGLAARESAQRFTPETMSRATATVLTEAI